MSDTFYCADLHFSHKNIVVFTNKDGNRIRPFFDMEEHDEILIENWNKTVSPNSKVYVLGDVCINKKGLPNMARLNGKKCLIKGNHDIFKLEEYMKYFYDVRSCHAHFNPKFIMTHIPIHPSELERFGYNVHGHLHHNSIPDERYICVSMEHINFTPINHDDLMLRMK
jgi:calcineurin-like phosphoesterase family protein